MTETPKPRIFLVGNPDKTGFAHEMDKDHPASLDDPLSRRWISCVGVVGWIVTKKYAPKENLTTEWFDRELCFVEWPGSGEFRGLVRAASGALSANHKNVIYDKDAIAKLFAYSPPITDCSIPMPGTEARVWFDVLIDKTAEDTDELRQINTVLKKLIQQLESLTQKAR